MRHAMIPVLGAGLAGAVLALPAVAGDVPTSYPAMAPIAQYRMESRDGEIALARSAAPRSISGDAEILVLGAKGYETAVTGRNGFVCLVERSWTAGFNDPVFWNPHIRGPNCLNQAGARTVLPHIIERTQWVLSGLSRDEMIARTKAELAAHTYLMPAPGTMSFMMSKDGYLSDDAGHWHPHLMFYVANADAASWGAGLPGSPVFAGDMSPEPLTIFYVPVAKWSDGTPATMAMK